MYNTCQDTINKEKLIPCIYNSFHKLRWNRNHERTTHKAQALYLKVRDRQQIVHTDYKAKEKGTGLISMEALLPYN